MANRERGASLQDGVSRPVERRFSLAKSPTASGECRCLPVCHHLHYTTIIQHERPHAEAWCFLSNTCVIRERVILRYRDHTFHPPAAR